MWGINMSACQRMPCQGTQGDPISLLASLELSLSLSPSLPPVRCQCTKLLRNRDFLTTLQSRVHKPFTWVFEAWL